MRESRIGVLEVVVITGTEKETEIGIWVQESDSVSSHNQAEIKTLGLIF